MKVLLVFTETLRQTPVYRIIKFVSGTCLIIVLSKNYIRECKGLLQKFFVFAFLKDFQYIQRRASRSILNFLTNLGFNTIPENGPRVATELKLK